MVSDLPNASSLPIDITLSFTVKETRSEFINKSCFFTTNRQVRIACENYLRVFLHYKTGLSRV